MSSTERKKKREAPISYRPPAALREEFNERVRRSGLSANAYLTKAWTNQTPPKERKKPPKGVQLLAHQNKILADLRDELRRIEAVPELADQLRSELDKNTSLLIELRNQNMTFMGRKP